MADDPYTPPQKPVEAEDVDAQGGPTLLVALAGFAAAAAGIMLVATAWQLTTMLRFRYLWQEAWVYGLGLSGAVTLVSGAAYTQARGWSVYPTLLGSIVGAVGSWAWAIYAFANGGFNLINVVGAATASGASVLTAISMPMALRVARARAALIADLID